MLFLRTNEINIVVLTDAYIFFRQNVDITMYDSPFFVVCFEALESPSRASVICQVKYVCPVITMVCFVKLKILLRNGACAHYVMVSKFQWKPFWFATQRDPQNDWTATQNRVNYDVFAQAPSDGPLRVREGNIRSRSDISADRHKNNGWSQKRLSIKNPSKRYIDAGRIMHVCSDLEKPFLVRFQF